MILKLLSAVTLAAFFAFQPAASVAVEPDEVMKDQKLEHRAREISAELRCLVCQNQSIDDSDASLAKDLRLLVRERLQAGDTDQQVMDYISSRYSDFVLLKPPLKLYTLLLWATPFVVLILGGWGIYSAARRRKAQRVAPLSSEEQAELDALLKK